MVKSKTLLFLFVFLLITAFSPDQNDPINTYILVRHAEKVDDSSDPELSDRGFQRTMLLDSLLSHSDLHAIYTTDYTRTRETVKFISDRVNLQPQIYNPREQQIFLKELLNYNQGETILISGHSNTIPELANLLLNREHFTEKFDESDYSNVLIITRSGDQASILHLRY